MADIGLSRGMKTRWMGEKKEGREGKKETRTKKERGEERVGERAEEARRKKGSEERQHMSHT